MTYSFFCYFFDINLYIVLKYFMSPVSTRLEVVKVTGVPKLFTSSVYTVWVSGVEEAHCCLAVFPHYCWRLKEVDFVLLRKTSDTVMRCRGLNTVTAESLVSTLEGKPGRDNLLLAIC